MLVDEVRANLDEFLLQSDQVIDSLMIHDRLAKLIEDLDTHLLVLNDDIVAFDNQTPHFFGLVPQLRLAVNFLPQRFIEVRTTKSAMMLGKSRIC